MFGYVIADRGLLTEAQLLRYQSCYCGLCRSIGQTYGSLQRTALSYDITFLVLLLSSLYEPTEQADACRCVSHPLKPQTSWQSDATAYGAAMNMALAYYNCMDNWHDDRNLKSYLQGKLFHGSMASIESTYPKQCQAIAHCIQSLTAIEQQDLQNPDAGANLFGTLMGTLFLWKNDRWEPLLRQLGESLGRFIYLADALLDLPNDCKRHKYNPFRTRFEAGMQRDSFIPILKSLLGECTEAFERLPLVQDVDLMRNILYSGVWTRFYEKNSTSSKEDLHV